MVAAACAVVLPRRVLVRAAEAGERPTRPRHPLDSQPHGLTIGATGGREEASALDRGLRNCQVRFSWDRAEPCES